MANKKQVLLSADTSPVQCSLDSHYTEGMNTNPRGCVCVHKGGHQTWRKLIFQIPTSLTQRRWISPYMSCYADTCKTTKLIGVIERERDWLLKCFKRFQINRLWYLHLQKLKIIFIFEKQPQRYINKIESAIDV